MTKKKISEEQEAVSDPPATKAASPQMEDPSLRSGQDLGGEYSSGGYSIGKWAGMEQYRCMHCAFDTLEKGAMLEHLFWVHSIISDDLKEDQ